MHRKSQSVSSLSTLLGPDAGADSNASAASSSRARMRSSQGPVRSSRAPALGGPSERVGGEGRLARLPGLSESGERADRSPRTDTASGLARASSTRRKEERARHPASGLKRSSTVSSRLGEGGRARESSGSSVETAIYRGVPGEAGARDEVRASMSGMAARRAVVRESNISEDSAVRPSINSSSGAALGTYNHPVSVPTPGPIQPSTPRTAARAGTHHVSGSTPRRSRASRTDGEATPRSRREESRASGPHARRSARHMAESIDEEIGRALYMLGSPRTSHKSRIEAMTRLEKEMMLLFPKARTQGGSSLDAFLARNVHRPLLQLVSSQASIVFCPAVKAGSSAWDQAVEQLACSFQLLQGLCMVDWRGAHGCAGELGQGWCIEILLDLLEALTNGPLASPQQVNVDSASPAGSSSTPTTLPALQIIIIELLMPIMLAASSHARRFERAGGLDTLASVIQAVKSGSASVEGRAAEERDRLTLKCGEILYYWTHYRWMLLAEEGEGPVATAMHGTSSSSSAAMTSPKRSGDTRQSSSASSAIISPHGGAGPSSAQDQLPAQRPAKLRDESPRSSGHRKRTSMDSSHSRSSSRDSEFARRTSVSNLESLDAPPSTPRKDRRSVGLLDGMSARTALDREYQQACMSSSVSSGGLPSTPRKDRSLPTPNTPARRAPPSSALPSSASMHDLATSADLGLRTPCHRSRRSSSVFSDDLGLAERRGGEGDGREVRGGIALREGPEREGGVRHARRESGLRDPRRVLRVLGPLEEEPVAARGLGRGTADEDEADFARDVDRSMHSTLRTDQGLATPEPAESTRTVSKSSFAADITAPGNETPRKQSHPPRARMSFGALASDLGLGLPGMSSPSRPPSGLSQSTMDTPRKASPLMQRADNNGATPHDSGVARVHKPSGMKKSATSGGLSSIL